MPFRDILYGTAAKPLARFARLIYHYSNVHRCKNSLLEPTIYPTSDTYLVFSRTPSNCRGYLAGPRTFPRAGEYVTDDTNFFVVSLSYAGSYALLPVAQNELTDKSFPLEDVFPQWGKNLTQQICRAANIEDKVLIFEDFLKSHYEKLAPVHPEFAQAIEKLSAVSDLENYFERIKSIGYSERQLRRIFLKYTGVTPHKFSRIVRCQTAIKYMVSSPGASLTDIAHDLNYFDQTHFTKEFKTFYALTPTQFIKEFAGFGDGHAFTN